MDISKLKTSDWVVAGSGLLLFIASFLDWFKVNVDFGFGSSSAGAGNGWDVGFFWGGVPTLLGLAMVAVVAIRAFSPETKLPELPISWGQSLFAAGCVAAAIVILKLLIGIDDAGGLVEVKRGFGIFLAAASAIGLAAGGFLTWQGEQAGETFNTGTGGTGGPGAPGGPGYPQGPGGPGYQQGGYQQQGGPGAPPPPPPPAGGPGAPPPPPPPGAGY